MGRAGFNLKVKSELFNSLRIKVITKASWTKYTDAFYLVLSEGRAIFIFPCIMKKISYTEFSLPQWGSFCLPFYQAGKFLFFLILLD